MPVRNYKDIYTLQAQFPEAQAKRFAETLKKLSTAFKELKQATTGRSALSNLSRIFGSTAATNVSRYAQGIRQAAAAIDQVSARASAAVGSISSLRTELAALSSQDVTAEVSAAPQQQQQPASGTPATSAPELRDRAEAVERLGQSYLRLNSEALKFFSNEARVGNALQITSGAVNLLQQRLTTLTASQGQAASATSRITTATRNLNQELANSTNARFTNAQRARVTALLREQQARDRNRLVVEKTIAAYERENGTVGDLARVRRDLLRLVSRSGTEGEDLNKVLNERLRVIQQLNNAERTSAANRKAINREEALSARQQATAAVGRAFQAGTIRAQDTARAIRDVNAALKNYQGTAQDAAAVADRLTRQFIQQSETSRGLAQRTTRQRLQNENQITQELSKQVQQSKLISREDANVATVTKQIAREVAKGNIARRDGLRLVEQTVAAQRSLRDLGPEQTGFSQFAQLTLLAITTAKIEQSIRAVIDAFAEFEQQLTEVRKTASATEAQMSALGRELLTLGQEIPIPAQELAQIAGVLGQVGALEAAGKSVDAFAQSAREAVSLVAEVAIATDLTAEEAAKSFGQLRAVFANDIQRIRQQLTLLTGETADVTDALRAIFGVLNEVSNATVATVGDLSRFIQNFGGVASAAGVAVEEVAALGGAIRDLGVSPQVAGTALSRLFQEATRKAEVFAQTIGTSTEEWVDLFATDANEALLQFLEQLGQLSAAEQARTLTALAARQRLRNTIVKLAQATQQQADGQKTLRDRLAETTSLATNYNSIADEAAKFSQTWNASINRLQNAITSVGNALSPLLRLVAQFIDAFSGLVTFITNIDVFGSFATSLVAIGVVIVGLRLKFLLIKKTLDITSLSLRGIVDMLGLSSLGFIRQASATEKATLSFQRYNAVGHTVISTNQRVAQSQGLVGRSMGLLSANMGKIIGGISLLGITIGSFVDGPLGEWITGLSSAAFTLQLLSPLLGKVKTAIAGLSATLAGSGGALGALGAGLGKILSASGIALGALAAKAALVATAIAGVVAVSIQLAARLQDLVLQTNRYEESLEGVAARVGSGQGGFTDQIVFGFSSASDAVAHAAGSLAEYNERLRNSENLFAQFIGNSAILSELALDVVFYGFANGVREFAEEVRRANDALRATAEVTSGAVPSFLEALGLDQTQQNQIIEGVNSGLISVRQVLSSTRDELTAFVSDNEALITNSLKVREALEEAGESAEDVNEIFGEGAITAERLSEIIEDYGLNLNNVTDAQRNASESARENAIALEQAAKATKQARLENERLQSTLEEIASEDTISASVSDIEKLARNEFEENNDLIRTRIALTNGVAEKLESIKRTEQETSAELERRQDRIIRLEGTRDSLQRTIEERASTNIARDRARLQRIKDILASERSVVTSLEEQNQAYAEQEQRVTRLAEVAEANLRRRELQAEAAAAEVELTRRREVAQATEKALQDILESNADLRVKTEEGTSRKLLRVQEEYYAKIKEINDLRIEDSEKAAEILVALEQNHRLRILQVLQESAADRIKARQDAVDEEKKALNEQQKIIEKGFSAATKEANRQIKSMEKQIVSSSKALDTFNDSFQSIFRDLGDPFANLAQGITEAADAARSLVAAAAKTGDLVRVQAALEAGAEAIERAAFNAGRELARIGDERRRINEEAAQLTAIDQQGLREFRDAYQKNLADANITEIERGRRAELLRQRAGEVLGEDAADLAGELADTLDNERQLKAILDQTDLQRQLVALTKEQTSDLKEFAKSATEIVEDEDPQIPAKLDELILATKSQTPAAQRLAALVEQQQAILDRIATAQEEEGEAEAPQTLGDVEEQVRQLESIREKRQQLIEKEEALAGATDKITENFRKAEESLPAFLDAIDRTAAMLSDVLGESFRADRFRTAAADMAHSERSFREQATRNREEAARTNAAAAELTSEDATYAREQLLRENDGFLKFLVEQERKRIKADRELTQSLRDSKDRLQSLERTASLGGSP
ncbi:MAG: phage tail tape measure protein [Candidatus Altiarchaeales archaeon]|nr:phage tail tape measure protein [Candidatus Altiarchaeales archaeon]